MFAKRDGPATRSEQSRNDSHHLEERKRRLLPVKLNGFRNAAVSIVDQYFDGRISEHLNCLNFSHNRSAGRLRRGQCKLSTL